MVALSQDIIVAALRTVKDPESGEDIVACNMISGLQVSNGDVLFMIVVDPARGPMLEPLRQEAENVVAHIPGVKKVTAILTAETDGPQKKRPQVVAGLAPRIKHIIAVA